MVNFCSLNFRFDHFWLRQEATNDAENVFLRNVRDAPSFILVFFQGKDIILGLQIARQASYLLAWPLES